MSTFNKLNNNQNKIISDLNEKHQENKSIFNEYLNWKRNFILSDDSWITVTPQTGNERITIKNSLLPLYVDYDQTIDINLPKKFIPFIKSDILVKTPDTFQTVGVLNYKVNTFTGDYVEVYGDGTELIYKGFPYGGDLEPFPLRTQADLDAGMFQEDFTKKVYEVTVNFTKDGNEYRATGFLSAMELWKENGLHDGLDNPLYTKWESGYSIWDSDSINYSKILSLSLLQSQFHCVEVNETLLGFDILPNIVVTKQFNDMDKLLFLLTNPNYEQHIGINWTHVSPPLGAGLYISELEGCTDISLTAERFVGYQLYYDSHTRYYFSIINVYDFDLNIYVTEGNYFKKELWNLPDPSLCDWTSIVFKRNYTTLPTPTTPVDAILASSKQSCTINLFPNDTNPDKFKINVKGRILLQSPATDNGITAYPVYNDAYLPSGSTYVPTENHTLVNMNYFTADVKDIQYKIQLSLTNPSTSLDRKNYEL